MKLLMLILACEALTELVVEAEIFERPRNYLKKLHPLLNELLECGYCVSVWMAIVCLFLFIFWDYTRIFVYLLIIHRASNFLHDIFSGMREFVVTMWDRRE